MFTKCMWIIYCKRFTVVTIACMHHDACSVLAICFQKWTIYNCLLLLLLFVTWWFFEIWPLCIIIYWNYSGIILWRRSNKINFPQVYIMQTSNVLQSGISIPIKYISWHCYYYVDFWMCGDQPDFGLCHSFLLVSEEANGSCRTWCMSLVQHEYWVLFNNNLKVAIV